MEGHLLLLPKAGSLASRLILKHMGKRVSVRDYKRGCMWHSPRLVV